MEADQKIEYKDLVSSLAVHIDKLQQDSERHSGLAFRAGELAADLKAEAKRSKLAVEEIEAEVDKEVRADPDSFGLTKITESVVSSAVTSDRRVQEARRREIDAAHDADKAGNLASAYDHRRSMLKGEIELYVHNYFGDPEQDRSMRPTRRDVDEVESERMEEELADVQARRRRKRET